MAERHGAAAEPDLDTVLDMVDAVAIAVPPDVQVDLACRAAERGCHLLLEKPLALSVEGADRVVEAADRAGVQSVVFFVRRFAEPSATWFDEVVVPVRVARRERDLDRLDLRRRQPVRRVTVAEAARRALGSRATRAGRAAARARPRRGRRSRAWTRRRGSPGVQARRRRGELRDAGADCARGGRTHVHEVLGPGGHRRSSPRRAGLCDRRLDARGLASCSRPSRPELRIRATSISRATSSACLRTPSTFWFGSAVYPFPRSGMGPVAQLVFKTGAVV